MRGGVLSRPNSKMSIRVLVVESHPNVRAGIRALFSLFRGIEIVGETDDLEQTPALISSLKAQLVLMDISQSGGAALEMVKRLRSQTPEVKVIVLSLDPHTAYVRQALRAGVDGYLLKNLAEELEPALRAVSMGGSFFTRAVSGAALAVQPQAISDARADSLSPRQREVLKLIAEGHTTKEIADKLGISFKTAQTHRTELMQRLDIHEVATLVRYAIRIGMVQPD